MRNLIGRDPEQFIAQNPSCVVLLRASWCGRPCESLVPVLKEIGAEYPHVAFGYLDVEGCQNFVSKHQVVALPTVLGFVNGELKATSTITRDKSEIITALREVFRYV